MRINTNFRRSDYCARAEFQAGRRESWWIRGRSIACLTVVLLAITCLTRGQSAATGQTHGAPSQESSRSGVSQTLVTPQIETDPALLAALGQLFQKLQQNIQLPPERSQSKLLPLLPESTLFYAAFPNFGEAAHQALTTFQQQIQTDPQLRSKWNHGQLASESPKLEDFVEKFYEFSQYVGDEMVIAGSVDEKKEPNFLFLTEIRKPGAKAFLTQMAKEHPPTPGTSLPILEPRDLATAKEVQGESKISILVREDYLIAASNVATLRRMNERIDANPQGFASTPFGERVIQAYEGGVSSVGAIDLQKVLQFLPRSTKQNEAMLQQTGFADAKYLVWKHKSMTGQSSSEAELSFTGPRHGIASWLAAPGPMGSLDFIDPAALMAFSVRLKSPAEIFDDISTLASASNPRATVGIIQSEQTFNISWKKDLLSQLSGEIALELDKIGPNPAWKAFLRVTDPQHLQTTLNTMFAAMHLSPDRTDEGGVTYRTIVVPSGQKPTQVSYAFFGGYLILGSSREAVTDAIQRHENGDSLAKSAKFLASLPAPPFAEMSGVLYEDAAAMMAFNMRNASPQMADLLSKSNVEKTPIVMSAYGEESALREISRSAGVDTGAMMIAAAVAIPNLMRARTSANEASAVANVRTVNVAQITYAATYPDRGYARDMSSLGPDPQQVNATSPNHAGLINAALAGQTCSVGAWCTKDGYQFGVKAVCLAGKCIEYAVTATPESSSTVSRSFCSTSDGVVRSKIGAPLIAPVTVKECRTWMRLQ
jgi:hypothetical protein